jgi:hypothetical protein
VFRTDFLQRNRLDGCDQRALEVQRQKLPEDYSMRIYEMKREFEKVERKEFHKVHMLEMGLRSFKVEHDTIKVWTDFNPIDRKLGEFSSDGESCEDDHDEAFDAL